MSDCRKDVAAHDLCLSGSFLSGNTLSYSSVGRGISHQAQELRDRRQLPRLTIKTSRNEIREIAREAGLVIVDTANKAGPHRRLRNCLFPSSHSFSEVEEVAVYLIKHARIYYPSCLKKNLAHLCGNTIHSKIRKEVQEHYNSTSEDHDILIAGVVTLLERGYNEQRSQQQVLRPAAL